MSGARKEVVAELSPRSCRLLLGHSWRQAAGNHRYDYEECRVDGCGARRVVDLQAGSEGLGVPDLSWVHAHERELPDLALADRLQARLDRITRVARSADAYIVAGS